MGAGSQWDTKTRRKTMQGNPVRYLDPNELIWEAPPKSKNDKAREARERWSQIAATLKGNPYEWAIITVREQRGAVDKTAATARLGADYEVTSRSVGVETRLYARYAPKGGNG